MDGVLSTPFDFAGEGWVACRAPQNRTCARLIDVAVALRGCADGARGAVAILSPPSPLPKGSKLPREAYVRRYQAAAWLGLGVVFVLDAPADVAGASWNPLENWTPRGDFEALVAAIETRIADDSPDWIPVEDSRELEGLVRISVHHALSAHDFHRSLRSTDGPSGGKSYQGYWRRAEADGVWSRAGSHPTRIALEVKLGEDIEAPLCQVIDDLGHSDAVVNVRGAAERSADYGDARAAMDALCGRLPVRYLDL